MSAEAIRADHADWCHEARHGDCCDGYCDCGADAVNDELRDLRAALAAAEQREADLRVKHDRLARQLAGMHGGNLSGYTIAEVESVEAEREAAIERAVAAEQRADTATAEVEQLRRRLWPDQGEGYANEVERQRAVIDQLQHGYHAARERADTAEALLADARRFHTDEHHDRRAAETAIERVRKIQQRLDRGTTVGVIRQSLADELAAALSSRVPVQSVMDANHISIPGPVQPEGDQS